MPDKQLLRVEPLNRNDVVEIIDEAIASGRISTPDENPKTYRHTLNFMGSGYSYVIKTISSSRDALIEMHHGDPKINNETELKRCIVIDKVELQGHSTLYMNSLDIVNHNLVWYHGTLSGGSLSSVSIVSVSDTVVEL